MNGNIATLTESNDTIVASENFFVETARLVDGQTDLKKGTILIRNGDPTGDEPLVALTPETMQVVTIPYGILLEDVSGPTENSLANVLTFGKVKKSKLIPQELVRADVIYTLRMSGIYVTEGE